MEQTPPAENKQNTDKKKSRVGLIVLGSILLVIIGSYLATVIVYSAVFARWDGEASTALPSVEHRFMCGENELVGELYGNGSSQLLVICSGFHALQEDYTPVIKAFLDEGFSVFTFDPTGVGRSGGKNQVGFPQIVEDLSACLDYVEDNGYFGADRLTVLGHSRGGYAALCLSDRADAVIAVGAPATPMDGVLSGAYAKIGVLAYLNYPNLWVLQSFKFGFEATGRDAVKLVLDSPSDVFIVQGSEDTVVPKDRFSVFARRGELASNASIIIGLYENGHTDVLYSDGEVNGELMIKVFKFLGRAEELAA